MVIEDVGIVKIHPVNKYLTNYLKEDLDEIIKKFNLTFKKMMGLLIFLTQIILIIVMFC